MADTIRQPERQADPPPVHPPQAGILDRSWSRERNLHETKGHSGFVPRAGSASLPFRLCPSILPTIRLCRSASSPSLSRKLSATPIPGLRDGSTLLRNSLSLDSSWPARFERSRSERRQVFPPPILTIGHPSVARAFQHVVFGMVRHKQIRILLIGKDIPALVVQIWRFPRGS